MLQCYNSMFTCSEIKIVIPINMAYINNLCNTINQPRAIDASAMLVVDATNIATKCWDMVPPQACL